MTFQPRVRAAWCLLLVVKNACNHAVILLYCYKLFTHTTPMSTGRASQYLTDDGVPLLSQRHLHLLTRT